MQPTVHTKKTSAVEYLIRYTVRGTHIRKKQYKLMGQKEF